VPRIRFELALFDALDDIGERSVGAAGQVDFLAAAGGERAAIAAAVMPAL
jgi:hypothetical protein